MIFFAILKLKVVEGRIDFDRRWDFYGDEN